MTTTAPLAKCASGLSIGYRGAAPETAAETAAVSGAVPIMVPQQLSDKTSLKVQEGTALSGRCLQALLSMRYAGCLP